MKQLISIIEDDQFLGDMLAKKLEEAGYEVVLHTDGLDGYQSISKEKPDLILLDIMLPSKNGYQILEDKKNDPSIADIPVIVVSNSGQPVEITRVVELGALDYFVKAQVDPDEIVQKVKKHLLQATHKSSVAGRRVLMVEDDKFLSDLLGMKLLEEGCDVTYAKTGEDALIQAQSKPPEIILLDIVLQGMDGFSVLEALKTHEETKDIPVLILSNLGQAEDIARAKELGAKAFFVKAMLTPEEIVDEIRTVLE